MAKPVLTDEIRKAYLEFFQSKKHLVVPSASLIPTGDPTLLLTSAGMVPFKPYFTGEERPPAQRLSSVQKCFRTSDIDEVGDTKHLTCFEMLGNFSIGEYFKEEAITWAWEFCTEILELSPRSLWVTYYKEGAEEDREARDLWLKATHGALPEDHIVPLGLKYNWWGPAGEEGPCGPCSEIHYSHDPKNMTLNDLTNDSVRATEIWNLVFTQYYHHRDGNRTDLPAPNIDTGMGLERTAAIMQEVSSVYETDAFSYLLEVIAHLTHTSYGQNDETDRAIRITTEHARGMTFLIADGVVPSNEGRGYVLRRILRRAARFGRKAGIDKPFLPSLADAVIQRMGNEYPELQRERAFILSVVEGEEERFGQTLGSGMQLIQSLIKHSKSGTIDGADVFRLYDTYGFPPDITQDIAQEHGIGVDVEEFETLMNQQRERGRAAAKFGLGEATSSDTYRRLSLSKTQFNGYNSLTEETIVLGLVKNGTPVEKVTKGDHAEIILRETPFYAEGGGQVGDIGEIRGPQCLVQVLDTLSPIQGLTIHLGEILEGQLAIGESAHAIVDSARRLDIIRNHTGTHLLHASLRQVLGPQVRQAGSLVAHDRLRFDFTHTSSISQADLNAIEGIVNDKVMENLAVTHVTMSYQEAVTLGALAFFGDKYGDDVRTCRIGPSKDGESFSFELCGGTHVQTTGQIGLLHLGAEGSIGAGTRRLEAVTGRGVETILRDRHVTMEALAKQLQTSPGDLTSRLGALLTELDKERKRASTMEKTLAKHAADALISHVNSVGDIPVLAIQVQASSNDALRDLGDSLKAKLDSAIIVLGAIINDRPAFLAMITSDLVARGHNAGDIVRAVAKVTGGGGGGRPEIAQAGGQDKGKLIDALALVPNLVQER